MKEISLPPRWFARLFATSPIYWVCLLGLCAAYIQGGLVKATDFNGAVAELAHFGLPPSSWLVLGTIFTELVGSILILSNCYRWLGAFLLAGFTLTATFVANRFWEIPAPDRFMVENAFFEHLGLVGGFLLVAWHDIRDGYQSQQRQKFASR